LDIPALHQPAILVHQEEEMSMLGEITHLQTLTDDLKALTMDPHKLPPASEQVSDLARTLTQGLNSPLFACYTHVLDNG
jgi:hypothetical protein